MDFAIPGAVIAERYRLTRPLGEGSSAVVWEAHDIALGRMVAVKLLRPGSHGGSEAQALGRLAHPRIVTVYDHLDTVLPDGTSQPVLVTELLDGTGLDTRLAAGPVPVSEALRICAQLADALRAAHQAGIVHRDLKPGNVMLTAGGVMLLDFGIARTAEDDRTPGGMAVGTPACMAPEQLTGRGAVPASDVYALGCVLYWCLTGNPPYTGSTIDEVVAGHLHAQPPQLAVAGVSPRIVALFQQCLAKDPAQRPSAGSAFGVLSQPAATPAHRTMVMQAYDVPGAYPPPPSQRGGAGATIPASGAAPTSVSAPGSASRPAYPEQPVFTPVARSTQGGRWTTPVRLTIGAVVVAAAAAGVTAFAMHGKSQNTAGAGAGASVSPSGGAPTSTTPSDGASSPTSPTSAPTSDTTSDATTDPATRVSPTDPGGNPTGYLEAMRAQIQGFIAQGQDTIDPSTAGDVQNAIADLENAVATEQQNDGSKNQRNVKSKISALKSKISKGADGGKIGDSTANTLSDEVQSFSDAFDSFLNH